ncbi:ABZJ_00895 family protein [Stutzerimonas azotifigens]|uniref:ABZJ_00895 family protein n=1 Tax=Stutzerimonas azotifigens TaxID=291995 RepID=UPI0004016137|nr:ABZJ_00895 family protein [Stutzerimonas azotifigens]
MTIKGVVLRYLLTYVGLLLLLGQALSMLGIGANEGIFIGLLVGSGLWPCLMFGRRNGRYFDRSEKTLVVASFLLIDLIFQIIFGNLLLPGMAPLLEVLLAFAVLVLLHAVVITLVVQWAGRLLARKGLA